ncbi:hypothetical protein HOLleu_44617 [Holothuria leucospilota]|uniref:C2H2-type domain-containing protein n=1 Tax=Holothuria leucospilota TaxID=206669 RepID=A0A9Q1B8L5_HOLLE|nr:hypothetical protein HOLleu_44617 [Holothuria leucospilota]
MSLHLLIPPQKMRLPVASSINLFLRGPRDSCNIKEHVADLVPIIKRKVEEGVKFVVFIADGGPDFNPNHLVNQLYWTRMFRVTGLLGMIVTTYCPGHSALNPIEHLWAPLTNCLAGVYLPDTLGNEKQPPSSQPNLTEEERRRKEDAVFDEAMDRLTNYWKQVKWAGLRPKVCKIPSRSTNDEDYKQVHSIVNGPLKGLTANVATDFKYMADHMDRRVGQLIFSQCGEDCGGCQETGTLGKNTLQLLQLLRKFPSPAPANSHEGHMLTFLEAINSAQNEPDEWMPRVRKEKLGRCPHCRCHIFTSESNRKRHLRMFHH